jgi:magnesium transporter
LSRVWSGSKIVAEDLDGPDLADVLELHSDAFAWWVLSRRPEEVAQELRDVAVPLDLDVVAIADLVAEDNRAKFDQLGHSRLVIANAVTLDAEAVGLTVQPTSMVVTDRALICLVGEGTGGPGSHGRLNLCRALAREQPALSAGGVTQALLLVLGGLVQGYEDVVDWLESSSEKVTQGLFGSAP